MSEANAKTKSWFLCFVLIFKTEDDEASFEKKMPGGGGMLCGSLQSGWQRNKTLSLRSNMCINSPQKNKKADDKPETRTIKKRFKFKIVNTNVQSQINMQESARLSMYLVCLEIDYFKY